MIILFALQATIPSEVFELVNFLVFDGHNTTDNLHQTDGLITAHKTLFGEQRANQKH